MVKNEQRCLFYQNIARSNDTLSKIIISIRIVPVKWMYYSESNGCRTMFLNYWWQIDSGWAPTVKKQCFSHNDAERKFLTEISTSSKSSHDFLTAPFQRQYTMQA